MIDDILVMVVASCKVCYKIAIIFLTDIVCFHYYSSLVKSCKVDDLQNSNYNHLEYMRYNFFIFNYKCLIWVYCD